MNTQPTHSSGLDKLVGHMTEFAGAVVPVLRRYEGNQLREELALSLTGSSGASFAGAEWKSTLRVEPVSDREATFDIEWTVKLGAGNADSVGVGLGFSLADWSLQNYVLLPAAVYAGNNFEVVKMKYPPLWRHREQYRLDMPITITDLPRLSETSHVIEQTTGDVAAPCFGFYSPLRRQGFLVQTMQQTRFGNSGLFVETNADSRQASFLVTTPAVRQYRQDNTCRPLPSEDRAAQWKAGDCITLTLRACFFAAPELQTLFDRFCELRKDLNPSRCRETLPFSAAFRIVEEKYNRDNWVEQHGYYRLAPTSDTTFEVADNPINFLWQLCWVGGGQATLPLLFQGDAIARQRAWRNLEMIFEKTQAPSGLFYGIGDGQKFYSDGFDRPWPHNLHMTRKSAEWLLFAIKHFDLLRKQGRPAPAEWERRIRRLADALVRIWEKFGQFGQFTDIETGDILVGGSASCAIAPAGLARAAIWFEEPKYLAVAQASARKYYELFACKGITNGGPSEILSAPDSESCYALLESFVTLLEAAGDNCWRKASADMVRQYSTWVVSYDYRFPPGSLFGQSGARTTGVVWANIQNKHGAPGICTFSGDALLRLWRATGDALALDLLRDTAHGLPQYLSHAGQPLGARMKPGWMCERVNLSDWEGAANVGGNLFGSCFPEVSLMLTDSEIPGLYVQPDSGFFCVFDHIKAERISHADGILKLRLTNPTKFDAEVKVLCEASARCRQPLDLNALYGAPVLQIAAGESQVETFACEACFTKPVRGNAQIKTL
jgi:hypothetical protein